MAISQTFTQNTLPPSAVPHTANLASNLKKLLTAAGYQLPNLEDRSSALQLDSTLSFYDYGLNGNDSLPLARSIYTYPATGVVVEVASDHLNGYWQLLNRLTSIYDEQGRLVDAFAQVYEPSVPTWVNDSRMEIFPHSDSPELKDSVFISGWDPALAEWGRIMSITNLFDAEDRIYESWTMIAAFGEPVLFKDVYTYDDAGDNTLIESYYVENNVETLTNILELKYKDHFVVSEVAIIFDGIDFIPETRVTTERNPAGQPVTMEHDVWDFATAGWFNAQSDTFGYDVQQRLSLKETAMHNEGVGDERFRFEYDYIEGELLQLETSYFWGYQENSFILDGRKYYFYSDGVSDAPGKPREVASLVISPNPTVQFANIELEGKVVVQVYDAIGQLVSSQTGENGRLQLDLSAMPAGMYVVHAAANQQSYIGKLVKQ